MPSQRCGTCRWFKKPLKGYGSESKYGACKFPAGRLPEWVKVGADAIQHMNFDGELCQCWEATPTPGGEGGSDA